MTEIIDKDTFHIKRIETRPYGTNGYILEDKTTRDSVLVDAPGEADKIMVKLSSSNPQLILITHSHGDHTGALRDLKSRLNIPVAAHSADASRLPLAPDLLLKDGDRVSLGNIKLEVLHTPGHTPGGLCFFYQRFLISGDTLFPGGPGRTGSPSDLKLIIKSLKEKIFPLPDETYVFPGHGDSTVLKKEKDEFAVFMSRPHSPDLCGDVVWLSS